MTERALEDCGFVRVPSDGDPLWMSCESCSKSDHFWIEEADGEDGVARVRCRCGAGYTHAVRPDGEKFPAAELTFTPFKEGPMQLADLELDPKRLVAVAGVLIAVVAGLYFAFT